MRYRQGRVLEALRGAPVFLDSHREGPDATDESGARREIDAVAAELHAHAVQEDGGQRQAFRETAKQRVLREWLRVATRPIAEVAARLRDTPQFAALCLLSHQSRRKGRAHRSQTWPR